MSNTRFSEKVEKYLENKKKAYVLVESLQNTEKSDTGEKGYLSSFVDNLIDGLVNTYSYFQESDTRKEKKKGQAKERHDQECTKLLDSLDINSKTLENDIDSAERQWKQLQDNPKYKEYGFICDGMKEYIEKMLVELNKQRFDVKCDTLVNSLSPNKPSFEQDIEALKLDWVNLKDQFKQFNFSRNDVDNYIQDMEKELDSQKKQCEDALDHGGWAQTTDDSLVPQERIRTRVNSFEQMHNNKKCYNDDAIKKEIKRLDEEEEKLNKQQEVWESEQRGKQKHAFCKKLDKDKEEDSKAFVRLGEQKIKDMYDCEETSFDFGGNLRKFPCHLKGEDLVKTCDKYNEILGFIMKREEYTEKCRNLVGTLKPNDQDFDKKIKELQTQWQEIQNQYKEYKFKTCDNVETYIKKMEDELSSQKKECENALDHDGWAQAKDDGWVPQERMKERRTIFETQHDGKKCHNDQDITKEIEKLDEEDKQATEAQEKWESDEHDKQKDDICNQLLNPLKNVPSQEVKKLEKETIKDVIKPLPINCEQSSFSFGGYEQTFPCHIKEEETVGSCTNYGDILDRLTKREVDIEARNKLKAINSSVDLKEALKNLNASNDPEIQQMTQELNKKLLQLEIQEDQNLVDEFAKNLQPPTGKEYDGTLVLLEKELAEMIQILKHKEKVDTTSFTDKIEKFKTLRDSCNETIQKIEMEFKNVGKLMPGDMKLDEGCKINDIEDRLKKVKSARTTELKEYKDIAQGNLHKTKKELQEIMAKKGRIPDEDYKQMQAVMDGRDSIFNLIQQQFRLTKGIAEQYNTERKEFEEHNNGQKIEVEKIKKIKAELIDKTNAIFNAMAKQAEVTRTIESIS
jgi:hypothetical protein